MTSYADASAALRARFNAALAAAQAIEPDFVLVVAKANQKDWQATGGEYVLRAFDESLVATRPAAGNPQDRVFREAHVDIFLPKGIGDELGPLVFEAISAAFLTEAAPGDGLIFEGPPEYRSGVPQDGAWFAPSLFPYHFNRGRPAV